jgi:hypothetical protein
MGVGGDTRARRVEKLAVFEAYLEAVVETSQEFDEVGSLLKRHETLTLTNRDLRGIVDNGNQAIEHTRAELTQVCLPPAVVGNRKGQRSQLEH